MSTTVVVTIVVAVVLSIVIGVMVILNRRKKRPVSRTSESRYREEVGAPGDYWLEDSSAVSDVPDPEGEWPPLPRRDPEPSWSSPPPFTAPRTPMIRRGDSVGPDHELSEDEPAWDPWERYRDPAVVVDDSPSRSASVPEPDRCDPIARDPWAAAQREESQPASFRDDSFAAGSTRDDAGPAPSYGSGADIGGYGGSSGGGGGDGGSPGGGGGCD